MVYKIAAPLPALFLVVFTPTPVAGRTGGDITSGIGGRAGAFHKLKYYAKKSRHPSNRIGEFAWWLFKLEYIFTQ